MFHSFTFLPFDGTNKRRASEDATAFAIGDGAGRHERLRHATTRRDKSRAVWLMMMLLQVGGTDRQGYLKLLLQTEHFLLVGIGNTLHRRQLRFKFLPRCKQFIPMRFDQSTLSIRERLYRTLVMIFPRFLFPLPLL